MITSVLRDDYERLFFIDMSSLTQFVVYKQKLTIEIISTVLNFFTEKSDVARKPSVMV